MQSSTHTYVRTHIFQMYRKTIRDHRRNLNQVQQKVEDVHSANQILNQQLLELEVSVSERKQVENLAGELMARKLQITMYVYNNYVVLTIVIITHTKIIIAAIWGSHSRGKARLASL